MVYTDSMELDRQQFEEIQRRLNALQHSQDHSLMCAGYECTCTEPPDTLVEEEAA